MPKQNTLAQETLAAMFQKCWENYGYYVWFTHNYPDLIYEPDPEKWRYKMAKAPMWVAKNIQQFIERKGRGAYDILLLSLPPQHSKSSTVTECLPSWNLGKHSDSRNIIVSYNDDTAKPFMRRNRARIGELGEPIFGIKIGKVDTAEELELDNGRGSLISRGIGSGITSKACDLMIVDDPIKNREQAESKIERDKIWNEWTDTIATRMSAGGKIIVIACMAGDTPVRRPDGTTTPLREIKAGDQISTYDNGTLGASTVKNHGSSGIDCVFKITTSSGRTVKANARHPFLLEDNGELKWIRLKYLTTGCRIVTLKGNGENGKTKLASLTAAKNPLSAVGIAIRTTIKKDGPTGIALHRLTRKRTATHTSNTGMGLPAKCTTNCWLRKTANALFASRFLVKTHKRFGAESFALTTATKPIQSEGFCATTAISQLDTPNRKELPLKWRNTLDFTTEAIIRIDPCGTEEVFDVQIEHTENFIANGLVSHNTRWHEDDLIGRILANEDPKCVTSIRLPCEAEENDPLGRKVGDALCPEFGKDNAWLASTKYKFEHAIDQNLGVGGMYSWNALYQGRPSNAEGNEFKRYYWRYWKPKSRPDLGPVRVRGENGAVLEIEAEEFPDWIDERIQSWDCTFKETAGADRVSGGLWERNGARIYLTDHVKDRMDILRTMSEIEGMTQRHPKALEKLIEDKANGPAVIQMLRRKIFGLFAVNPEGGKVTRANAIIGAVKAGNVYLPHPALYPWVIDYINEMAAFPNGKFDDDVDMTSQALNRLIHRTGTRNPDRRKPMDTSLEAREVRRMERINREHKHGKKPVYV